MTKDPKVPLNLTIRKSRKELLRRKAFRENTSMARIVEDWVARDQLNEKKRKHPRV